MSSKFMFYADTHLKSVGSFSPYNRLDENGLSKELNNIIKGFKFVADQVREHKPSHLFHLGDMYHNPSMLDTKTIYGSSIALGYIKEACDEVGCHHIIMMGNHDIENDKFNISTISTLSGYGTVITDNRIIDLNGFKVGVVQYNSNKEIVQQNLVKSKDCNLIITHLDFKGARYETGKISESSISPNLGVPCIAGDIHCLSEDTEILTNNGFKRYDELSFYDKCVSLNCDTNNLEYKKINNTIIDNFCGDMVNIKTMSCDQLVSPEHRVLIEKGSKYKYIKAKDIKKLTGKCQYNYGKLVLNNIMDREPYNLSDEGIRLLVWLAGDGCLERNNSYIRTRLVKKRKIQRFKHILDLNKVKYSIKSQDKKGQVSFNIVKSNFNEIIKTIIKLLTQTRVKSLPWQITSFNYHQSRIFIDEASRVDGNQVKGNNYQLITQKQHEADLIQEMCVINGISCSLQPKIANKYKKYHRLSMCVDRNLSSFGYKNVSTKKYDGVIWCINTEYSNFLVRRNGKIFITGNSATSVGDVTYCGSLVQNRFNRSDLDEVGGIIIYDVPTGRVSRIANCYSKHYIKLNNVNVLPTLLKILNPDQVVLQVKCFISDERTDLFELLGLFEHVYLPAFDKVDIAKDSEEPEISSDEPITLLRGFVEKNRPETLNLFDMVMGSEIL